MRTLRPTTPESTTLLPHSLSGADGDDDRFDGAEAAESRSTAIGLFRPSTHGAERGRRRQVARVRQGGERPSAGDAGYAAGASSQAPRSMASPSEVRA
jgi:hypothetical protein